MLTPMVARLDRFSPISKTGTDLRTPKVKTSLLGSTSHQIFPHFAPKTPILNQKVLKIHANINPIYALKVCKLPKFPHLIRNRGQGT